MRIVCAGIYVFAMSNQIARASSVLATARDEEADRAFVEAWIRHGASVNVATLGEAVTDSEPKSLWMVFG